MDTYFLNTVKPISAEFVDSGTHADVDPDAVYFWFQTPAGVATTYQFGIDAQIVRDAIGKYHVDLTLNEVGFWAMQFSSVGPGQAVFPSEFYVHALTSPEDLTTLTAVKNWAEIKKDDEDADIADCITAFGHYMLNRTGRDTLNVVKEFTEEYDGHGTSRLFLRNFPITALTSVMVNGISVQISLGYNLPGVYVDGGRRKESIGFRDSAGGISSSYMYPSVVAGGKFLRGQANIQVVYRAGYAEAQTGFEFTATPPDLEMAARKAVALNYKRKAWQDLRSKSLSAAGGAGTTSYYDWEFPPDVARVILDYCRGTY